MRTHAVVWTALMLLTLVAFGAGESVLGGVAFTALLLVAAVKSLLVGWHYMELRSAHPAWRLVFSLYLAGFLALFLVLSGGW